MVRIQTPCMIGGKTVSTGGIASTTKVIQSYPYCTVTVYYARNPITPISTLARSSGTVTVETMTAHMLYAGLTVVVAGAVDAAFDGTFVVISPVSQDDTSTTVTYAQAGANTSTTGGTITASGSQRPPLYSDNGTPPTAKANPYTADVNGFGYFYSPNGCFNIQLSGGSAPSIPVPYTYGDVCSSGGGTGSQTGWEVMTIDGGGSVTPVADFGSTHSVILNRASTAINHIAGTVLSGQRYDLVIEQDATGGRRIVWDVHYKGVSIWEISTVPSTRSVFSFIIDPSGDSVLEGAATGLPL